MKKTLIAMFALAGLAMGLETETTDLTLPATTTKAEYAGAVGPDLANYKSKDKGTIWLTSNANGLGNYPQNGEGTWVNNANVGTITFCGRAAAGGDHMAMILGSDITAGTKVTALTFSAGAINATDYTVGDYTLMLGVYNGDTQVATQIGASGASSVTISFDEAIEWSASHKIVALVKGAANQGGSNTTAYTIDGIKASVTTVVVPEPATATLSLLALAGLAARRRRH